MTLHRRRFNGLDEVNTQDQPIALRNGQSSRVAAPLFSHVRDFDTKLKIQKRRCR